MEKNVTLTRGAHAALSDIRWLVEDLVNRPTRLYELVPISPTVDDYQDASGKMCGVVLLPVPTAVPR